MYSNVGVVRAVVVAFLILDYFRDRTAAAGCRVEQRSRCRLVLWAGVEAFVKARAVEADVSEPVKVYFVEVDVMELAKAYFVADDSFVPRQGPKQPDHQGLVLIVGHRAV